MLDLIVNPYAGRGRAKTDAKKVFEILDANNVKFAPHYTARKKHATEIAYNLTLSGAKTIVSVGGDGTLLRANALAVRCNLPLLGVNVGP